MYFLHTNCLHHFYVDDVRIASKNQEDLDKLLANLTSKNLIFTREGSFTDFLEIKSPQEINKVTITLTQKGLINKIKQIISENKGKILTPKFDIYPKSDKLCVCVEGWNITELVDEEIVEKIAK